MTLLKPFECLKYQHTLYKLSSIVSIHFSYYQLGECGNIKPPWVIISLIFLELLAKYV